MNFGFNTSADRLKRYVTAYSPLYEVYVNIDFVRDDVDGNAIVHCSSDYSDVKLDNHLFRANELTQYCM